MHLLLSRADESLELIFTKKKCVWGGNVSFTFLKKNKKTRELYAKMERSLFCKHFGAAIFVILQLPAVR